MDQGTGPRATFGRRATYAALLMIGFYSLAVVIAGFLLYLPYAEWRYMERVDIRLVIFAVAGAFAILAAIFPRTDHFEPPGPLLTPQDQPNLFRLIEETAAATEQAPPAHVYLIPDLNAWVAERGGTMGVGSERVMGVGLPLLQALSVTEFRAVLAHEFGHYHAGDTALGPWLYNTRAAIGRTLANLSNRHWLIGKPFEWYGGLFLRITHAVSREQEYAADALAARVAGGPALASGLKAIHAFAPVFPAYWVNEVAPALETGVRPPILDGFQRFLTSPAVAPGIAAQLEAELAGGVSDPLDTHPALRDRIAAIDLSAAAPAATGEPRAISLFPDPDRLEEAMVAFLVPPDLRARLTSAGWKELAERVWLPRWQKIVAENRARLQGVRPGELAALASPPTALPVRMKLAASREVASEQHIAEARWLIGAAIAVALRRLGFGVSAMPGEPVVLTRDDLVLEPFAVMERLATGTLAEGQWGAFCRDSGLDRNDLAA